MPRAELRNKGGVWNVPLEAGGLLVGSKVTMQLDLELMWVEDAQG